MSARASAKGPIIARRRIRRAGHLTRWPKIRKRKEGREGRRKRGERGELRPRAGHRTAAGSLPVPAPAKGYGGVREVEEKHAVADGMGVTRGGAGVRGVEEAEEGRAAEDFGG
ncbi:uncharacterized protein [Gossypium hirsutum]|uniref:Uncharacterized protein n=1 Tax=Gossypium hirsutum TaxID=3635 RepID=A0ABM2Z7F5_GOSHI|nr:uncharacterized protein LOC121210087 [Gossypium hirsutum]